VASCSKQSNELAGSAKWGKLLDLPRNGRLDTQDCMELPYFLQSKSDVGTCSSVPWCAFLGGPATLNNAVCSILPAVMLNCVRALCVRT
jgi:hypothetical protein